MKTFLRICIVFFLFPGMVIMNSCSDNQDESTITKARISGLVQKGPYINGTTIQMYELSSTLGQTGKSFTTKIINNQGTFEIDNITLSSQYVEIAARGYYFNENTGDISSSELSLNALSDVTDISTVNVNILTHLEKDRVEYLVANGQSFSEAKATAQAEVLAMFGFTGTDIDASENLNIAENSEGNAMLMAISVILQGERTVGDLTELLANISNDIKTDGVVNDNSVITALSNSAVRLDRSKIRTNLENRYLQLGVSATIPDFEKYIDIFIALSSPKSSAITTSPRMISSGKATLCGSVNAFGLNTVISFEYGLTTDYGNTVSAEQSPMNSITDEKVIAKITGLLPETTYHYRIVAENIKGISYGEDKVFNTCSILNNTFRYVKFESYYSRDNGQVNVYEIKVYSGGQNVALNKSGYVNSPWWGDFSTNSGNQAVDGNEESRWSSDRDDPGPDETNPHYIVIDLGRNYAVESVYLNIKGGDSFEQTFDLMVSQDSEGWNSIISGEKITGIFTYDFK